MTTSKPASAPPSGTHGPAAEPPQLPQAIPPELRPGGSPALKEAEARIARALASLPVGRNSEAARAVPAHPSTPSTQGARSARIAQAHTAHGGGGGGSLASTTPLAAPVESSHAADDSEGRAGMSGSKRDHGSKREQGTKSGKGRSKQADPSADARSQAPTAPSGNPPPGHAAAGQPPGTAGANGGAAAPSDIFNKPAPAGAGRKVSEVLGEIVWLLSQSPLHKQFFISDLEWLVMTPVLLQQFRLFYDDSKPIGVAFWATVSAEVEERLAVGTSRLRPQDWKSGERLWVVEVIAPFGGAEEMVKDLKAKVFPQRELRFLSLSAHGRELKVM